MTELKTLKDIVIIGPDGVEDSEYVKRLLKAEAVKWIKYCENVFSFSGATRDFWMERFNITEEELAK